MVKINNFIKQLFDTVRPVASTVLFIASTLSLIIDPMKICYGMDYNKFDRTIGMTTLAGINSETRIQLYMFFNLLFIPLCLLASMILCYFFVLTIKEKLNDPDIKEALSFLDASSICALILVLVFIINKYNYAIIDIRILTIPLMVSLCTLLFLRFPIIQFKVYRVGMILSITLSLFVNFMFQTNTKNSLNRFFVIFVIISVITQIILIRTHFKDYDRLTFASVPLSYAMLFVGISLELFNILNRHNIFIINRLRAAKLVFIAFITLCVLLFALSDMDFLKKIKAYAHWETISLMGIILSFAYFNCMPPQVIAAGSELFETANHGLLVNDFLNWGKFPIINSFDAHTMTHSLGCILYGLLNDDVIGAAYFSYAFVWNLITVAFSFVVFKNLFDKYFSFFLMVIAPIDAIFPAFMGFNVGVICIAAMLYAVRKKSFSSYLMMFFSILLTLIFNIPVGFSYGGAVFIAALIGVFSDMYMENKTLKQSLLPTFSKALAVFTGIVIIAYVGICLQQHINPIKRAIEFLGIAMSTNNWSRPDIGDATSINYGLAYSFVPFAAVICIFWLITHFKNSQLWYTTFAVLGTYVFNITRTLQRHTLSENMLSHVLGLSLLGISLFLATYLYKHKKVAFAASGMFLLLGLFNIDTVQSAVSTADRAISAFSNSANYYDGFDEKIDRVDITAPRAAYRNVLSMIDSVIPEGETYLDLTGQTMLYALSGREKPVYANQSVTELSGEYSQRRLIEEVEEEYKGICDFALVDFNVWTMNIDGVSCFARYYIVLEYLYDNYRPLCRADEFALWVRKDRYEEFNFDDPEDSATDVYTIPILQENSENNVNSLKFEITDSLKLICDTLDPYITIPFESPVVLDYTVAPVEYYVEIVYRTNIGGSFQIFYDFNGFNETNSSCINVFASETYKTMCIPVSYYEDISNLYGIRLDPPSDSKFEITSLKIISTPVQTTILSLEQPIFRANITDSNWTNGVFNFDPRLMVFARENAQMLLSAKTLYSAQGSANVTDIIANGNWIQIKTDKDASFFDNGITAVYTISDTFEPIDYDYLDSSHSIELGKLPYVWGRYDTKKAWNNPFVCAFNGSSGILSSEIQQSAKYAVISIDSLSDGRALLSLRNSSGQNVTEFCFDIKPGINSYIIRCSADWFWNTGVIRSFTVNTDVTAEIREVSFLKGDREDYEG